MRLRYIDCPALPGDFNMAADFILAERMEIKSGKNTGKEAVLRLYTWLRPTISLGFHQNSAEIDYSRCRKDGIEVVRRPTGGRAILHWQELTYCFILPVDEGEASKSALSRVYQSVHRALGEALSETGAQISFSLGEKRTPGHNPLCFASSAGSELEYAGKKALGSAQRLLGKTILQHGSIILGPHHLLMPEYFNLGQLERQKLQKLLKEKSTYLEIGDSAVLRRAIAEKIAEVFHLELLDDDFTLVEKQEIEKSRDNFSLLKA